MCYSNEEDNGSELNLIDEVKKSEGGRNSLLKTSQVARPVWYRNEKETENVRLKHTNYVKEGSRCKPGTFLFFTTDLFC